MAANNRECRHPLDRLIAAAAVLIGASKAWSDPRDRRVIACADEIEKQGSLAGPMPTFSGEQIAEAQTVWAEFAGRLDTPASAVWMDPARPLGVADGKLWVTAPEAAVAWIKRRYASKFNDVTGLELRPISSGRVRVPDDEEENGGNQE